MRALCTVYTNMVCMMSYILCDYKKGCSLLISYLYYYFEVPYTCFQILFEGLHD